MSELGEKIAGTIEWLIGEPSKLAEDEILAAFKAHIKGCSLLTDEQIEETVNQVESGNYIDINGLVCPDYELAFADAQRKALMESLE